MALAPLDLALLALYLAGVVAVGLWQGRRQRNLDDYLLGSRDLPWWAVMGSIVATETSTASFLSLPGRSFAEGGDLRFLQLALGYVVGRVAVSTLLLPGYFRGRLTSAYQLLGTRFGPGTQRLASAVFLVARVLGDGLRLFLAALALEAVAGLGFAACVGLVGAVTALYTVFGGMRSIVWNDCAQLVVYLVGGAVVLGFAVAGVDGGWAGVVEFGAATGRWRLIDTSVALDDPYTLWAGLIGGAFLTLGVHGTDQMLVQRCLSARSARAAGRALVTSGLVVGVQFALFLTLGVALAAYFAGSGADLAADEAVARFVVDELPAGTGLVGLLLAAVLAASMSTCSSSLNSSASSVIEDWILPLRRRPLSDRAALATTRGVTLAFAAAQVGVALAARGVSESVVSEVLAIASFSAGLLLGLFALAHLVPRADGRAAAGGLCAGLAALLAARFGPGPELAWTWFPLLGSSVVLAVGTGLSRPTPQGDVGA